MLVILLGLAACGNSGGDQSSSSTTAASGSSQTGSGEGGEAHRDEHVAISGVPGVSDDKISFAVIGTKGNNPLGTCILDCYTDGIKAYFAWRNSQGGIYKRDLVIGEQMDDELSANQARALDVISNKKSFADFNATLLATGWGDLDDAGIPTYAWGINATEAANRSHIFPSAVIRCADCTSRFISYIAKQAGAKKVGILGYGATENSKVCAQTAGKSVKKYAKDSGVSLGYLNDDVAYGMPNGIGPEVSAMKKAGVDFISTCIDLNGMKTLAQELHRQGMDNVVLFHPNSYNQKFIKDGGSLFQGDYVTVGFRPFEADTKGTQLSDFKKWIAKTGAQPSELAMVGWINADEAYQGLLAAGPRFDRDKVTAATNAMKDYNAGGLLDPINWGEAHTPYTQATRSQDSSDECGVVVKVEDGKFHTVAPPDKPWLCWSQTDLKWSDPKATGFGSG